MEIEITDDIINVNWCELAEVFRKAPLGSREPDKLQRGFENSYAVCFALDGDRIIGAARAISDGECYAAIYDVVVLPEFQRKGVGRRMMEFLIERLPVHNILLTSAFGKERFYRELGFRKHNNAFAWYTDPSWHINHGYIE